MAGQVVVQMRVPEISLENGLQAQNKHDLCRTISIQNGIDKLNTFKSAQFHLWWCQVCGHGSLEKQQEPRLFIVVPAALITLFYFFYFFGFNGP